MDFCGWWGTSCGTGGIYSQAKLKQTDSRGIQPPGAGADIWCSIGTGGKWDYTEGNGSDSFLDRFTDLLRTEYARRGCKTHHLWGELHTAWNNLFWFETPHKTVGVDLAAIRPSLPSPIHPRFNNSSGVTWKAPGHFFFCYAGTRKS